MFENEKSSILERETDKLAVISVDFSSTKVADVMTNIPDDFPSNTPDSCGAILLFHTDTNEIYGLGCFRHNPVLCDYLTEDGSAFQKQIDTAIGGRIVDTDILLKDAIIEVLKFKFLLGLRFDEINQEMFEAKNIILSLISAIEHIDGWSSDICAHTNNWISKEGEPEHMCFLTAIKHIRCSSHDLNLVVNNLGRIIEYGKENGVSTRNVSDFHTFPFILTMNQAVNNETIMMTELEKAIDAHSKGINVVVNDLCLAIFKDNRSYEKHEECSELILDPVETGIHTTTNIAP
jgi:hypothetical protein